MAENLPTANYGPGTGTPEYPAYRFHRTEEMRLVQNADEEAILGEGWQDHPYTDAERAAYVPPPVPMSEMHTVIMPPEAENQPGRRR